MSCPLVLVFYPLAGVVSSSKQKADKQYFKKVTQQLTPQSKSLYSTTGGYWSSLDSGAQLNQFHYHIYSASKFPPYFNSEH